MSVIEFNPSIEALYSFCRDPELNLSFTPHNFTVVKKDNTSWNPKPFADKVAQFFNDYEKQLVESKDARILTICCALPKYFPGITKKIDSIRDLILGPSKFIAYTEEVMPSENKVQPDTTIHVGNAKFLVHKNKLKSSCEYFKNLFKFNEKKYNYTIEGVSVRTFRLFLDYVYTNRLDAPLVELVLLYNYAEFTQQKELQMKLEENIEKGLNISNYLVVLMNIHQFSSELGRIILQFISYNYSKCMDVPEAKYIPAKLMYMIIGLDNVCEEETEIFLGLLKWAKQQNEKIENTLILPVENERCLLDQIRFDLPTFIKEVEERDLLGPFFCLKYKKKLGAITFIHRRIHSSHNPSFSYERISNKKLNIKWELPSFYTILLSNNREEGAADWTPSFRFAEHTWSIGVGHVSELFSDPQLCFIIRNLGCDGDLEEKNEENTETYSGIHKENSQFLINFTASLRKDSVYNLDHYFTCIGHQQELHQNLNTSSLVMKEIYLRLSEQKRKKNRHRQFIVNLSLNLIKKPRRDLKES